MGHLRCPRLAALAALIAQWTFRGRSFPKRQGKCFSTSVRIPSLTIINESRPCVVVAIGLYACIDIWPDNVAVALRAHVQNPPKHRRSTPKGARKSRALEHDYSFNERTTR
jgi:hypothetical protein